MATDLLRAAVEGLEVFLQRFDPCFGQRRTAERARTYWRGLLLHAERKNIESMTLVFGEQQANQESASILLQKSDVFVKLTEQVRPAGFAAASTPLTDRRSRVQQATPIVGHQEAV